MSTCIQAWCYFVSDLIKQENFFVKMSKVLHINVSFLENAYLLERPPSFGKISIALFAEIIFQDITVLFRK